MTTNGSQQDPIVALAAQEGRTAANPAVAPGASDEIRAFVLNRWRTNHETYSWWWPPSAFMLIGRGHAYMEVLDYIKAMEQRAKAPKSQDVT